MRYPQEQEQIDCEVQTVLLERQHLSEQVYTSSMDTFVNIPLFAFLHVPSLSNQNCQNSFLTCKTSLSIR